MEVSWEHDETVVTMSKTFFFSANQSAIHAHCEAMRLYIQVQLFLALSFIPELSLV